MRYEVNGTTLDVYDTGGDGPSVLFVHGFPDSHEVWSHQVEAVVGAGYRAITYDMRGFGNSDKPTDLALYKADVVTHDVVGVLDAVGVNKAHIVGHDWGATIAWVAAVLNPGRILSLTAISNGHLTAFHSAGWRQKQMSWYVLQFNNPHAEEWLMRDDAANFRGLFEQHPNMDKVVETMSEDGALTAALALYRAWAGQETILSYPPVLPPAVFPVMGIYPTLDPYLSEKQLLDSEQYVTEEWRYERLEGIGHWAQQEAPERVNRHLLDFLSHSPHAPTGVVRRAP